MGAIKWIAKSSVGGMFSMIPAKLIVVGLAAVALMFAGGWVNWMRWQAKYDKHIAEDTEAVTAAQEVARLASRSNAIKSARIDAQHFKELQHEKQKIADLRAGVATGAVRLRTNSGSCIVRTTRANPDSRVGERSEPDSFTSGRPVESDILDLAEIAKTAIAQRDYLNAKHVLDLTALGVNEDEVKK